MIIARIMLPIIFLCGLLSPEIFLYLLASDWLKITEKNFLIGKLDVVMFHICNLFLLVCPSYTDDFII